MQDSRFDHPQREKHFVGAGMIQVKAGNYHVWQGFTLTLQEEIVFRAGNVYHLSGPNGSGKSSFIHKVLWEKIIKRDDCYVIRIQQQMDLQLYAMRAWAAIYYPKSRIVDEKDVWDLMWTDLAKMKDDKPVVVISDEAKKLVIPQGLKREICLIYSSHIYNLPESRAVNFEPVNGSQSMVYEGSSSKELSL